LGRPLQSRQRAVVRPGPAAGRLHRDERPLLRVGAGEEEQRHRGIRGGMNAITTDQPQRTQRTRRFRTLMSVFAFVSMVSLVLEPSSTRAQSDEATRLLQEYVRIDTSNPPGDTRRAADWLAALFEREGIRVTRYESAPGKAILYARL